MMESKTNFEEIDFHKHFLVLQRRWLPATGVFGAVVALTSFFAFSIKPVYKSEGRLLIKTNRTASLTGLGEGIGRIEPLAMNNNPLDTQAELVLSVPVIEETIEVLKLKDDEGKPLTVEELTDDVKVKGTKGTEVLQVSYNHENPELAAKVVNKVMNAYIRQTVEANRSEAVSAGRFLLEQMPKTEAAVRRAESALRQFKENNQVISLQEEATAAVNIISKLDEQIAQAQAQLEDVTARRKKLQNQADVDSQQAVAEAALNQNEGIKQILADLQKTQSELVVAKSRLQPEHPSILNLEEDVAALKSLLKTQTQQVVGSERDISMRNLQTGQLRQNLLEEYARTEAQRVGLIRQITELAEKRDNYKQRATILPKLEQNQRQLERKLKAAQTTYESLLTRLQEVQITKNQSIVNARVVSSALVADKPEGSRRLLILAGGASLGLILGVVTAFGLDLIDRSVKTSDEAKEVFQYLVLGIIPSISLSKIGRKGLAQELNLSIPKVLGKDIPYFPIGEAYQMLQANLKFLNLDKKIQTIVVTSSVTKEGKSEVAANLAVAMAQVGHRVLLVDANMRQPVQHHVWKLKNTTGLSNIIIDQFPIERAIELVIPNLYVLPCGALPPNPVTLLNSQWMEAIVSSCRKHFDYVIFDTPTLVGTADTAVLGKLVDGILLVVRPGVIDSASANAAKEFLAQSSQKVLGMVINGVGVKNMKYDSNSYFNYTKEKIEQDVALLDSSKSMGKRDES